MLQFCAEVSDTAIFPAARDDNSAATFLEMPRLAVGSIAVACCGDAKSMRFQVAAP